MDIHVCKQCGSHFVYCRACTFRPVRYKDAGFCSKECYEASKINVAPIVVAAPIVEPEIIEEVVVAEELAPIVEEAPELTVEAEVEISVVAEVSLPEAETDTVAEPTPKKETYNAYKKKKYKH